MFLQFSLPDRTDALEAIMDIGADRIPFSHGACITFFPSMPKPGIAAVSVMIGKVAYSHCFCQVNSPESIIILTKFPAFATFIEIVLLPKAKEEVSLMKRTQTYVACLFVLALLAVPVKSAFAFFGIEAGVGFWQQSPSGSLEYKPVSATDSIDLKDDLNLGSKSRVVARVKAELPLILPNIYFMATPMSFDGTSTITRDISYGGTTFQANVPVQSKVTLDHYDLALFYPVPLLKTATVGVLNVELGLNARQINFKGTISQDSLGLTASKDLTLYVPMIYVGAQVKPISAFSIEAEIRGISYGKNSYYDYLGRLKIMPVGPLFISGGYRAEQIKIDQSDVKADVKFSGPFAEVGLNF